MVKEQIIKRGIKDDRVIKAMLKVPRHKFVPLKWQNFSYDDTPLPIGYQQTISQPYIVALMTELLELKG
ncbi:MAG: protein-L-isoaspartate O-methyltransferase, partial [Candidatus Omnitrophica bacterium]|nr:protein-L-isoaspartate O-methyltransferase [Candidatus Omnitrophota bacterium]